MAEIAGELRAAAPAPPHPALAGRLIARLGLERDDRLERRADERLVPGC